MRVVKIRKSDVKIKKVGNKMYAFRQRWLRVPGEYKDEAVVIVISLSEMVDILHDEKKREEVIEKWDELLENVL